MGNFIMSYHGKRTQISNFNAVENNNTLKFDKKFIAKIFKDFFPNGAIHFLNKVQQFHNLFICLFIYSFTYLSIYLFIYLLIHSFIFFFCITSVIFLLMPKYNLFAYRIY